MASPLKLVRYASISVAGQLVLDLLDDGDEFRIPQVQRSRS
jgi:hypothetical protein